jgi:hypothetical protein
MLGPATELDVARSTIRDRVNMTGVTHRHNEEEIP